MLLKRIAHVAGVLLLLPLVVTCNRPQSLLEEVQRQGELRMLTRNAATTYYEGPNGLTGLEYELAKGFADELGVRLKVLTASNVSEVLERLALGEAHFAAAGLTVTEPRQIWARFTPPYHTITEQLVYRLGNPRPNDLGDLQGLLEVVAQSSHLDRLHNLKQQYPSLNWIENTQLESEELLTLVSERLIDYTVADSSEVALNRRYYPELRVAFDISEPQSLAWAFPKFQDPSLYNAATAYFDKIKASGRLAQLLEQTYGHVQEFDYVGTRMYMRHVQQRLPKYRELFEEHAAKNGLDWRLLAAVAYQESHWNPKAVSPTGVRGMMMLTQATARQLGIEKRTDPTQSVAGGALYIRQLLSRVPERIELPDRLWLALAAYNVGFGHLEDARIITQKRGGNPDRWGDVKENLPLLRKKAWYKSTKHGYARGNEALTYVENIRSYYDILVWLTDQERTAPPQAPGMLTVATPAL